MRIDEKKLTERLIDAEQFKKFVAIPEFKNFYKTFDILEERALGDILTSCNKDENVLRSSVAYLKAVRDIKHFYMNAERNYQIIHDKIHEVANMRKREMNMNALHGRASNDIIKR
jgi:hypothetical protein